MKSNSRVIMQISLADYSALAQALGETVFSPILENAEGLLIGWRFPNACLVNRKLYLEVLDSLQASAC